MKTESYWPTDLSTKDVVTPVSILREQAAILGQQTENILEASVSSSLALPSKTMRFSFNLVAPALGHYEYELLILSQEVDEFYPATVQFVPTMKTSRVASEEQLRERFAYISALRKHEKSCSR